MRRASFLEFLISSMTESACTIPFVLRELNSPSEVKPGMEQQMVCTYSQVLLAPIEFIIKL